MVASNPPNTAQQSWRLWLAILLLLGLALPALWPLYINGYPTTDDGAIHLVRQALLDYHVRHGDWYPRWTPELFLGYGYPLFNFYGPATYYLNELLILSGVPLAQAMVVASGLMVLIGGVGMLRLATDYFSVQDEVISAHWLPHPFWAGLVAAVAYLYAPYLLTNLYVRGAMAELGAMALWPWVIWSCRRLLTDPQPSRYLFVTALLISAMTITHTITLLLLPPIVLAYATFLLWQRRQQAITPALRTFSAALVIAMGSSAFFWLPLLVERRDLSRLAYNAEFMPPHFWDWHTFLDRAFAFTYSEQPPQPLGLVQVVLVLIALWHFWRLGGESRFWVTVTALLLIAISRLAMPLWLNNDIGQTIQFPWRLLGLASLTFALITGAGLGWLEQPWQQGLGATLLIVLIIVGNRPRAALLDFRQPQDFAVTLDAVATFEEQAQAWGAGWSREFLPKWATAFAQHESSERGTAAPSIFAASPATSAVAQAVPQLTLTAASTDQLDVTAQAATPTQLQLNQLYFPGWQATLETGQQLPVTPAPGSGLLTVAVPAGEHQLTLRRGETAVERWATWFTLGTLLGFSGWAFLKTRRFGQALVALLLALMALSSRWPALAANTAGFTATTATPYSGLQLLGYRAEVDQADGVLLFPYWLIHKQLPDLQFAWQLRDQHGAVVSSTTGQPYFGTVSSSVWTVGMLVRDGYRLPLPPDLPVGDYQLKLDIQPAHDATTRSAQPTSIGAVTVPAPATAAERLQPLDLTFTLPAQVNVWLDGYTTRVARPFFDWGNRPTLVNYGLAYPGDRLVTRLYWRAAAPATEGYHSFLHLVDDNRQTLVAQDQLAGSPLNSALTWNRYQAHGETYSLLLPATAASGLYYPRLGLYTFADNERFLITSAGGSALGDGYDLPPIKVVNPADIKVEAAGLVSFGDFAQLVDVTVTGATPIIKAGESFTVTLTYQAKSTTAVNYTQFLQLTQQTPLLGTIMAAQFDAQPRQGANPTSAWVPGEVIKDIIELTIAAGTPAGRYQLLVGFYDGEGRRATVIDANGNRLPDAAAILEEIEVK